MIAPPDERTSSNRNIARARMIGLVQRVARCRVTVDGEVVGAIGPGMLILLGVHRDDTDGDLDLLARKCAGARIFADDEGKMNRSVAEIGGGVLVVSQFTLFGDMRRGMRPYFGEAAPPEMAEAYYRRFMERIGAAGISVSGGVFGARMSVELVNDGPVTIVIDTRRME